VVRDTEMNYRSKPHVSIVILAVGPTVESKYDHDEEWKDRMLRHMKQIMAQDTKMNCHNMPHVSIDVFAVGAAVESKYGF
jgi:hypothetical protein